MFFPPISSCSISFQLRISSLVVVPVCVTSLKMKDWQKLPKLVIGVQWIPSKYKDDPQHLTALKYLFTQNNIILSSREQTWVRWNLSVTHIDAGGRWIEFVFGQGWRRRRGQPWRRALVEKDAAVGQPILSQVSAHTILHEHCLVQWNEWDHFLALCSSLMQHQFIIKFKCGPFLVNQINLNIGWNICMPTDCHAIT